MIDMNVAGAFACMHHAACPHARSSAPTPGVCRAMLGGRPGRGLR